jgi:DNA-binding PadR family transcriptional regulator
MKELTLYESILLLAIWRLKDNAYGVTIREKVSEVTKRTISYGTLYSYLDQLSRKGYVGKTIGAPSSERGGRRKIFYTVSTEGMNALKAARDLQKSIWDDVPEFIID